MEYKEKEQKEERINRTGIPDSLLQRAEVKSGLSFEDVRVHYNSPMPAEVGALAYTQGNHIYVAPGQERYLPHELGHVVQQKEGRVVSTGQQNGFNINDDQMLEREADRFL